MNLSSAEKYSIGTLVGVILVLSLWHFNESSPSGNGSTHHLETKLEGVSSFQFFSESGKVMTYYENGELKEEESDEETWRTGGPTFAETGPNRGIAQGNMGSNDVEVYRTSSSVVFTERVSSGVNVFTVRSEWDEASEGFRASYLRNIALPTGIRLRSEYVGIAKPH